MQCHPGGPENCGLVWLVMTDPELRGQLEELSRGGTLEGMQAPAATTVSASAERCQLPSPVPSHVPSGAALLAIELSEEARGIRGLDVLRRSVDRAPPAQS